jgi:hypothetical protein
MFLAGTTNNLGPFGDAGLESYMILKIIVGLKLRGLAHPFTSQPQYSLAAKQPTNFCLQQISQYPAPRPLPASSPPPPPGSAAQAPPPNLS